MRNCALNRSRSTVLFLSLGIFCLAGIATQPSHAIEVAQPEIGDARARWPDMFVLAASYAIDWSKMYARYQGASKSPAHWRQALKDMHQSSTEMLLSAVNRYVNAVPYHSDELLWGTGDYWATPDELFIRGGDCEDFAIAKYFMLLNSGFSSTAMRIVVLRATISLPPHAVLVVETEGGASVLDNLERDPYAMTPTTTARIAFAVNDAHMWVPRNLHRLPISSTGTQVTVKHPTAVNMETKAPLLVGGLLQ